MPKKLENMTEAELQDEFRSLGTQISTIGTRRNAIAQELSTRVKTGDAKAKLRLLSKEERQALRRELNNEPD